MSKAEERALEAYPIDIKATQLFGTCDVNLDEREAFREGYQQAEKDLALTPDDIQLIMKIHYKIVFTDETGVKVEDVASEVLKRYLEAKK